MHSTYILVIELIRLSDVWNVGYEEERENLGWDYVSCLEKLANWWFHL